MSGSVLKYLKKDVVCYGRIFNKKKNQLRVHGATEKCLFLYLLASYSSKVKANFVYGFTFLSETWGKIRHISH